MNDAPPPPLLPEVVRARVVALAAQRLGALPPEEVPASLRAIARFTPAKRARLAAMPLAAVLENDPVFRQRVAVGVRAAFADLAAALDAGRALPAAPPEDVAAVAYLLRPPEWTAYVEHAVAQLAHRESQVRQGADADIAAKLREQLAAAREAGRGDMDRLRGELRAARAETEDLRRQLREAADRARRAEQAATEAAADAAAARAAAASGAAAAAAEARRARTRLEEATAAVESARRAVREGRSTDELRLRVLLDTLLGSARGLRRELGLAPAQSRPADAIADAMEGAQEVLAPLAAVSGRGLAEDDPALLDALLTAPNVHLVVDGYNVTKTAYDALPLEAQRSRLLRGLGGLAAQTAAEVTCVFDGTQRPTALAAASPRGVRLLFSVPPENADELIARLVRAEPPGRPVVVISSDREVADSARRAGARPLPSIALVRRLG